MKNLISYYYIWPGLYLYFSYLQDLIYNYLLKCLGYEPPSPCLSGQVGRLIVDLLLLSAESRRRSNHSIKPRQDGPLTFTMESPKWLSLPLYFHQFASSHRALDEKKKEDESLTFIMESRQNGYHSHCASMGLFFWQLRDRNLKCHTTSHE
jgi:hypothetical protein